MIVCNNKPPDKHNDHMMRNKKASRVTTGNIDILKIGGLEINGQQTGVE